MAKKRDASFWLFLFSGIIVVVLIALVLIQGRAPGQYDDFAQCLADEDVTMFGTYWCPNCAAQKELFGPSFRNVDYTECSPQHNRTFDLCKKDNITAVPTWEFSDGTRVTGVQSLESLAGKSGCSLTGERTGDVDDAAVSDSGSASVPDLDITIGESNEEETVLKIGDVSPE
ncbi:MAG: hypothetical protein O2877_00970 [bacterium]|nr:hypothetical protein [bacterium]